MSRSRTRTSSAMKDVSHSETVRTSRVDWVSWILASGIAVVLTWVFWWPLWNGGGLIGGDLYPYYFPQKVYLAECLQQGTIPLWNPWVGFGYPALAESQTGALYPPNVFLYRLFEVNTAYNLSQLGHYVLTFLATFGFARCLGLNACGGLLAATAFVYGWFPARICLEWSIIGGAWYVALLWMGTAYLQTGQVRYWLAAAGVTAISLLAGHFNLAFISLLTLIPLALLELSSWFSGSLPRPDSASSSVAGHRWQRAAFLGVAVVCGFLIAAVQLLPTWELKSLSQRQEVNDKFAPTYGHLPPQAISQLWMPWRWYAGESDMETQLTHARWLAVSNITNQVESQLYVGLLPLILAFVGLLLAKWGQQKFPLRNPWGWLLLIGFSLFLASGWPTLWGSSLPGLGFFRGPGRYSITAAFGIALLAGGAFDHLILLRRWNGLAAAVVCALVLSVTAGDLWAASRQYQFDAPFRGRQVFYATLVDDPAIKHLNESQLRKFFQQQNGNQRLYAPGQNIPSLLGVSCLPVYLGLGPEIYESDDIRVDFEKSDPDHVADSVTRLRRFGVTHLLLEQPLNTDIWPVKFLGSVLDSFLNRALGHREPYYFYELVDSPGRASVEPATTESRILSLKTELNRVRIEFAGSSSQQLILRDLWYPGWELSDPSQQSESVDELFRSVKLASDELPSRIVEWVYRPASVRWGMIVSVVGFILTITTAFFLSKRGRTMDG